MNVISKNFKGTFAPRLPGRFLALSTPSLLLPFPHRLLGPSWEKLMLLSHGKSGAPPRFTLPSFIAALLVSEAGLVSLD